HLWQSYFQIRLTHWFSSSNLWMHSAPAAGSAPAQALAAVIRRSMYSERATISLLSPRCPGAKSQTFKYRGRAKPSKTPEPRPSHTAKAEHCTVVSGQQGGLIARSLYRSKSTQTKSRQSAETAYWRFFCCAPSGTSRDRSLSLEVLSTPRNALDGG